jgi:hypothetical protein
MQVKINKIYKHFKGNYYIVEDIGTYTETSEKCVIYRALYGDNKLFVRPYKMFISKVDRKKYPDVLQEYRFEAVENESIIK